MGNFQKYSIIFATWRTNTPRCKRDAGPVLRRQKLQLVEKDRTTGLRFAQSGALVPAAGFSHTIDWMVANTLHCYHPIFVSLDRCAVCDSNTVEWMAAHALRHQHAINCFTGQLGR